MAYFAELDENNMVVRVISVANSMITDENGTENEQLGVDFCKQLFGQETNWKQTSYNTFAGQHKEGGTPFRKNYAYYGCFYNPQIDAFIPPKPEGDGFVLDEEKGLWTHPELERLQQEQEAMIEQRTMGVTRVNANN